MTRDHALGCGALALVLVGLVLGSGAPELHPPGALDVAPVTSER